MKRCERSKNNVMNLKKTIAILYLFLATAGLPAISSGQSVHHNESQGSHSTTHHHVVRSAPAWQLSDENEKMVTGNDYRGQVHVLIFHLGMDCLHCAEQLNTFAAAKKSFQQNKIPVITISHQTSKTLKQALTAYGKQFPFPMLADPVGSVFKSHRAFDEFNNTPLHGTIVIDSRGKIRWQQIGKHPVMDWQLVLKQAKQYQQEQEKTKRPKIFLDKSPRVVAYQLGRLNNARLLLVERSTKHPKYIPVYQAILERGGISQAYRDEALAALVKLKNKPAATILIDSIQSANLETRQGKQTAKELGMMLVRLPKKEVLPQMETLLVKSNSDHSALAQAAFAAMIAAGESKLAYSGANKTDNFKINWLKGIQMLPDEKVRAKEFDRVFELLNKSDSKAVKNAAIETLAWIPEQRTKTFVEMAKWAIQPPFQDAAVKTLLSIPRKHRPAKQSLDLVTYFVKLAEKTPAAKRTTDEFLNAMQLTDQLLIQVPVEPRKRFRARLAKVVVRVIKIKTVADEMRYDIPYFAVQAGRPIQIVLQNDDMAAHNLVVTKKGKMKLVAEVGGRAGPSKDYLPQDKSDVLFATKMIQPEAAARITFNAPKQPGEYPYVCTFPQHWSRMYGVMVVVEDLDAWLKNPVKPADPIGNTRQFVKKWKLEDFTPNLENNLKSRSLKIGQKIYKQANCAQCHKLDGEGAQIGPELDTVLKKHGGDMTKVIREILQPAYQIDEKYSMHRILTAEGESITGIVKSETDDEIKLLDNPDSKELITIKKEDIDEMVKTSTSIMPKALLDNFQKDEILDLIAYLKSKQKKK